jgi:hypothetical protein
MTFWAVIDDENRIRGTGFNAFSALINAKIHDTVCDDLPDLDDIPKTGLMHTIAELNKGLEGTPYRLDRITEGEYWDIQNQNKEKTTLICCIDKYLKDEMKYKSDKERRKFVNGIVRRFF